MKIKIKPLIIFIIINCLFFILIAPFVIFYGPFSNIKLLAVETIYTSRHPQVVEFFLSQEKITEIINSGKESINIEPVIQAKNEAYYDAKNGILIDRIEGKYFKGLVMLIEDPAMLELAVTKDIGSTGQRLSEMVDQNNALAGINGGGFYDPNAQGNGAYPEGITVKDYEIVHNNYDDVNKRASIIGFDDSGQMILEYMNAQEIRNRRIRLAVTFSPYLIKDGRPLIKGDGGWGLAPRTGIGQKADGAIIFIVIDGRQPGWSMGATLRDLMNVFIEYNAVNAANLDGGSSTEMIYKAKILNELWNIFGERYIPTAFIVK